MTFQELNLSKPILRAVARAGYEKPSPIQAGAIPPVLKGQDLMGCAQTGTGKTAAFALPILDLLSARPPKKPGAVRALVLTPTRELALQIGESFAQYGQYLKLRSAVIFGGVGQAPQVEKLRQGVDILVACPGRLNDLIGQGYVDLSGVEIFVLDEADRMLDMGFIHDVRKVIDRLPQRRQTLLFSATMPQEIADLSKKILHNPVRVEVTPQSSTVDAIEQRLYKVDKPNKRRLLAWLLQQRQEQTVLVFTATKHGADRVVRELGREGVTAMAIHGNKSQTNRVKALDSFKTGAIRVLVATDIAARGIDISELPLVINYDLPNIPETYVHRIGRTGRAGHSGLAISFCNFDELAYLKDIEKLIGKKVPVVEEHPFPMEILEPTPKAQRQPRQKKPEEKAETKAAPKSEPAQKSAKAPKPSKQAKQSKHAKADPSSAKKPQRPEKRAETPSPVVHTPKEYKPVPLPPPPPEAPRPSRKLRSGEPSIPGRVVAFADGRHRPKRRGNRGGGPKQGGSQ